MKVLAIGSSQTVLPLFATSLRVYGNQALEQIIRNLCGSFYEISPKETREIPNESLHFHGK